MPGNGRSRPRGVPDRSGNGSARRRPGHEHQRGADADRPALAAQRAAQHRRREDADPRLRGIRRLQSEYSGRHRRNGRRCPHQFVRAPTRQQLVRRDEREAAARSVGRSPG